MNGGPPPPQVASPSLPLPGTETALFAFARRHRKWVAYPAYALASSLSLLTAFALRFDLQVPDEWTAVLGNLVVVLIALRLLAASAFRLTTARWRYVGIDDLTRLFFASTLSSLIFLVIFRVLPTEASVPLSVVGMEWALFNFGVGGTWLLYRQLYERLRVRREGGRNRARRVLIVGAGESGNLLMLELQRMPQRYRVVGFLDDDPARKGTMIGGEVVLGTTADAADLVPGLLVDEIIIAIPSAAPEDLRRILTDLEPVGIPFRVLPPLASVFAGEVRVGQLRPLRIEDLLGREPISLEIRDLEEDLSDRTVLVTGAAGSIGSELARQIAANHPERLILLDQAESDLYFLDLELRERHPTLEIETHVGDVLDEVRIRELFERRRPDRVYHAAAYKHVPLMERNTREAIKNNVLGTWQVAQLAGEYQAGRLVLISTDKAADPVSAMGATKRAAELVIEGFQALYPDTHYVAVRFGNVLGSQGSVIPLFQKQIAAGGPLTITDPEVTRYFMTIPEAVQLVLQAGLLPVARGRIVMLQMGEPVRIVDLARNLVRLSGLRPELDIEFRYIGLRPGEKLHETLSGRNESLIPTSLDNVGIVSADPNGKGRELVARLVDYSRIRALMGKECLHWLEGEVLATMWVPEPPADTPPAAAPRVSVRARG